MVNLSDFDANEHEPFEGFDPIPPETYTAVITESEKKDTRAGDGQYLELVWQIVSGEYEGRLVWQRITLRNPSERAVGFGQRMLSAVCRAIGKMQPQDSTELHGIRCHIRVKIRPGKGDFDDTNEIVCVTRAERQLDLPF